MSSLAVVDGFVYYLQQFDYSRLARVPVATVAPNTAQGGSYGQLQRGGGTPTTIFSDGTTVFWTDYPHIIAMPPGQLPRSIIQDPQLGHSGVGALAAFEGWVYWSYSPECVGIYKSRSDDSETTFLPTHVLPESHRRQPHARLRVR